MLSGNFFAAQQLANIDGCGAPDVYDISSEDEESGKENEKNQSAMLSQSGRSHHDPIFISIPDDQCTVLKEKVMTGGNSKSPICLSSDMDSMIRLRDCSQVFSLTFYSYIHSTPGAVGRQPRANHGRPKSIRNHQFRSVSVITVFLSQDCQWHV